MTPDHRRILLLVQRLVGAMDTLTGILLVLIPLQTLRLMGIGEAPQSPVFLSWVGTFVFSIGMSYFLVGWDRDEPAMLAGWRMQWKLTAIARMAVAIFVAVQIARAVLAPAWLSVAVADALVAALQILGLRTGVLKGGSDR